MWIGNVNNMQIENVKQTIDNCVILDGEALLNISLKSETIEEMPFKFDRIFSFTSRKKQPSENTTINKT